MAAYLSMQLNARRLSRRHTGRLGSSTSLSAGSRTSTCQSPGADPDSVSAGYGMGWIEQTYKDGRSLVWHNGGVDGFTTFWASCRTTISAWPCSRTSGAPGAPSTPTS